MQVSLTIRDNYMNYAEGIKRVALVVYLAWATMLLGAVMLICVGNSNWFVAKLTFVALAIPLLQVNTNEAKKRLFFIFLFALAFVLIPMELTVAHVIIGKIAIFTLAVVCGSYREGPTSLAVSSMFLSWVEKPKASFALTVMYMIAVSSVFSWAVIHFSPDADITLRLATLLFPFIAVLIARFVASLFASVTGFVIDGFQQDQR